MRGIGRTAAVGALPWIPVLLSLFFLFRFTPFYRAVLLLLALLFHEGGHLLAFLFLGEGVPRLLPVSGGFRFLFFAPLSYRAECLVALAGPAANLLPGLFFLVFGARNSYAAEAGWIFVGTGLSNLIPIADHDGGRAIFCLLSSRAGVRRAAAVSAVLSYFSLFFSLIISFSLLYAVGAGFYFSVFCLFSLLSHPLSEGDLF